jgi:hypothetical protein
MGALPTGSFEKKMQIWQCKKFGKKNINVPVLRMKTKTKTKTVAVQLHSLLALFSLK